MKQLSSSRKRGSIKALTLLLVITFLLTGCVQRKLIITSNPPGADVFLNKSDMSVGQTPLEIPFQYYGTYSVKLRKKGYRPLNAVEKIKAPWFSLPGPDFIAEYVLPNDLLDEKRLSYNLLPLPEEDIQPVSETEPAVFQKYSYQLTDPHPDKRQEALLRLASLRDKRAREAILKSTEDPEPVVRAEAATALRMVSPKDSTQRLLEMLDDTSSWVRGAAVSNLEVSTPPEARIHIQKRLKDRDMRVRVAAIEALSAYPKIGPEVALQLVKLARMREVGVRRSSIWALGMHPEAGQPHIKTVRKALRDWNVAVRREAVTAVGRLGDTESVPRLLVMLKDRDDKIQNQISDMLMRLVGPQHKKQILKQLKSNSAFSRRVAAELLAMYKGDDVKSALKRAIKRERDRYAKTVMKATLNQL